VVLQKCSVQWVVLGIVNRTFTVTKERQTFLPWGKLRRDIYPNSLASPMCFEPFTFLYHVSSPPPAQAWIEAGGSSLRGRYLLFASPSTGFFSPSKNMRAEERSPDVQVLSPSPFSAALPEEFEPGIPPWQAFIFQTLPSFELPIPLRFIFPLRKLFPLVPPAGSFETGRSPSRKAIPPT